MEGGTGELCPAPSPSLFPSDILIVGLFYTGLCLLSFLPSVLFDLFFSWVILDAVCTFTALLLNVLFYQLLINFNDSHLVLRIAFFEASNAVL